MELSAHAEKIYLLFSRGFDVDFNDQEVSIMSRSRKTDLIDCTVSVFIFNQEDEVEPCVEIIDHNTQDTENSDWETLEYTLNAEPKLFHVEPQGWTRDGLFQMSVIPLNS